MPNALLKYARITFEPTGWAGVGPLPRIILDRCAITRRGGLEPDCWSAVVPKTELERLGLGDVSFALTGIVRLWYTHSPYLSGNLPNTADNADVSLGNIAITDVSPDLVGTVLGDEADSVISYRIALTDHRRAWVAPRGGLLFKGVINPDPMPDGDDPTPNSELMADCATAMGVLMTVTGDVDDVDPIRDLTWTGAHAPSELQRLLEHTGTVYAPLASGTAQVVRPGLADVPTIPAGRLISDVQAKSIDRRSAYVIYSSVPVAEVFSFNGAASPAPTWTYVAQCPDDGGSEAGKWKPLEEITQLGGDPATAWANALKDVDDTFRAGLLAQMYRCIQLDKTKFPPGKVVLLNEYVDTDLSSRQPSFNDDTVLVPVGEGGFAQHGDESPLSPIQVVPDQNIYVFPHPLMTLKTQDS